jgi:hypothetical protein
MSEQNAADVLLQDGPEQEIPAEVPANAEPQEGGEQPQADAEHGDEPEETKQKRLGGWQRRIQKQEREIEFWREQALKTQPAKESPQPVVDAEVPKVPDIDTFQGTMDEYKAALAEYPAKLKQYLESKREQDEQRKQTETTVSEFVERLKEVPELPEMQKAAQAAKVSGRLASYISQEAAKLSNGTDVLREAMLDPEVLSQLVKLDKLNDGNGILAQLHAISYGLRIANRKIQAEKQDSANEPPPPSKAPKPVTPASRPAITKAVDVYDPNTSQKDWMKAREAQLNRK